MLRSTAPSGSCYLPEALVNMLAAHVQDGVRPEGWLFVGVHDGPPHQNTVGYRWREDVAGREVERHQARTICGTSTPADLSLRVAIVVTVQRALGHATATTTLNTYSHPWPTG